MEQGSGAEDIWGPLRGQVHLESGYTLKSCVDCQKTPVINCPRFQTARRSARLNYNGFVS